MIGKVLKIALKSDKSICKKTLRKLCPLSTLQCTQTHSLRKFANVFMYEIMNIEQHMHIPDAMKAPDSSVSRGVYNNTF